MVRSPPPLASRPKVILLRLRLLRFASILAAFALSRPGGMRVAKRTGTASTAASAECRRGIAAETPGPIQQEPLPAPATSRIKVGVLLPLSGANAELGKAMLEAAQLALFATPATG